MYKVIDNMNRMHVVDADRFVVTEGEAKFFKTAQTATGTSDCLAYFDHPVSIEQQEPGKTDIHVT